VTVTVGGTPLDPNTLYTVATTSSAANGSFGYFKVWDRTAEVRDTKATLAGSLSAYLSAHNALNPGVESRIRGL
jgi:hypothetical protein